MQNLLNGNRLQLGKPSLDETAVCVPVHQLLCRVIDSNSIPADDSRLHLKLAQVNARIVIPKDLRKMRMIRRQSR